VTAPTPTLADLRADPRVKGALAKSVEWAEACDAAARETVETARDLDHGGDPVEVAMICGMAATAWAAVHAATRPNGAVP
jgi:hypothetical protein